MKTAPFALSPAERRRLLRLAAELTTDYWQHAADDRTPVLERTARRRPRPLPRRGQAAEKVLRQLGRYLSRNACHLASPRYYGLMNPKASFAGPLADYLASVFNQQLAVEPHAPGATALEREALGWLLAPLGWRRGVGQFTSGGSEANLIGLKVALTHHCPEAVRRGLRGLRRPPVFYASEEAHHSAEKFADLLGLGRDALRWIPTDTSFALRMDALAAQVRKDRRAGFDPFCVVATFGTTSGGAIDPIGPLARFCRRERLWLHVDGAYAGSLILSAPHKRLWRDMRQADSLTVDPHKWLSVPYPLGVILVRDPRAAAAAFRVQAAYVPRGGQPVEMYQLGIQWSRRFLGLKLWLALMLYGSEAYEKLFADQMRLAEMLRRQLAATGRFATVSESPLPITCFTCCEPGRAGPRRRVPVESLTPRERALNERLPEEIVRRGWAWISTTRLRGVPVMRMMVINYDTRARHIERLVADLSRLAADASWGRR